MPDLFDGKVLLTGCRQLRCFTASQPGEIV
jgi:hypothetical protein